MKCPLQLAESWKQISLWTCNFKFWQPQGSWHFPYEKPFLSLHGFPVPLEQSLCLLTCLSFQGKCLRGQINPLGPQKLLQKLVFPGSHWQVEPGWQESKTRAVIRAFQLFCGSLATFPCGHNWAVQWVWSWTSGSHLKHCPWCCSIASSWSILICIK